MRHLIEAHAIGRTMRVGSVVAAFAVAFMIAPAAAHAQDRARVNIDFAFDAGGQPYQAGAYDIEATRERAIVRPVSGQGTPVIMTVITRLGRHDKDPDPELVFDKVGGKFLLSELWFPGADGYLVLNTPTDHEHRVLGGSNPHK